MLGPVFIAFCECGGGGGRVGVSMRILQGLSVRVLHVRFLCGFCKDSSGSFTRFHGRVRV